MKNSGGPRTPSGAGLDQCGGPHAARIPLLLLSTSALKEQVKDRRQVMDAAEWINGVHGWTPIGQAQHAIARRPPAAEQLGGDDPAGDLALPAIHFCRDSSMKIFAPLFNRYGVGQHFGTHVDGAIRAVPGIRGPHWHGLVGYPIFGGAGGR